MKHALVLARSAEKAGEVPVGAILVKEDQILFGGHNHVEHQNDVTSHAEIIVIRSAGRYFENWRLNGSTLYVTLEPCPMCMTAIMFSRIDRVVWGCSDPIMGASSLVIHEKYFWRSDVQMTGGVLAEQSQSILKTFFLKKRKK